MNKKLSLIFLSLLATASTSQSCVKCLSTTTREPGEWTYKSHPVRAGNCNCHCTKKRTNNICSECGHTVVEQNKSSFFRIKKILSFFNNPSN